MHHTEPIYRAILWYKVGRRRQRWYQVAVGGPTYTSIMLADEVARWERKPNAQAVGTLVEVGEWR